MLYSIFSKFFSQVIPNDVMTKMVDEIQLPVDIVEIILVFIQEKKYKCYHCGFIGDNNWFVDGYKDCIECREFIQGNGLELE